MTLTEGKTMVAKEDTIVIGLAEINVTANPSAVLTCLGLGSCIGLAAYDPLAKVGGMVHIVLPSSGGKAENPTAKYADTAVPFLLDELCKKGALKSRLLIKIAGGAQMSISTAAGSLFKTGERNEESTRQVLASLGMRITAAEVGGSMGRTLKLYVNSGKVTVSSASTGIIEL